MPKGRCAPGPCPGPSLTCRGAMQAMSRRVIWMADRGWSTRNSRESPARAMQQEAGCCRCSRQAGTAHAHCVSSCRQGVVQQNFVRAVACTDGRGSTRRRDGQRNQQHAHSSVRRLNAVPAHQVPAQPRTRHASWQGCAAGPPPCSRQTDHAPARRAQGWEAFGAFIRCHDRQRARTRAAASAAPLYQGGNGRLPCKHPHFPNSLLSQSHALQLLADFRLLLLLLLL